MKSKFRIAIPFLIIFAVLSSMFFTGCSFNSNKGKTPQDLIEGAFGNEEFTISFSSETLDEPIKDIKFSANKIPKLPAPKKVGYIFDGWFLDREFVMPCTEEALYMAMSDLTLFPKWIKETFVNEGTYDIEFDAHIVEGTVDKGIATDAYGGYRNLADAFNRAACHIEKNKDDLFLKLEYDAGANTTHQSTKDVYDINVDPKLMDTKIYIDPDLSINALNSPVKTLFIRINHWDLSSTLYLDVAWTNFESEDLTEQDRYFTTTTYMLAIDLTKIIGFSQPFVDTSVPLEEGYYLAKAYYRSETNAGGSGMGGQFNPVYSYIYSDGHENYTLIKQNYPYLGLVARMHPLYKPVYNNYYDMMTSFVANTAVYEIDNQREFGTFPDEEFYPEKYNATVYKRSVTEFHADTGKVYNIIELNKDLKKEYICLGAVSGFMERGAGMGYVKQLLTIDYKTMIKVAEIDYEPLQGDYFGYESTFNWYPGAYSDLDERGLTLDSVKENGVSMEMPNLFFTAPDLEYATSFTRYEQKQLYSSVVEVLPTPETAGYPVSESRYKIAKFNVHSKIYGYEHSNESKLFIDRMSPQCFAPRDELNYQLRDVAELKIGKSCKPGDKISLPKLFKEKVDRDFPYKNVTYKAYAIEDDMVNYSKVENVGDEFTFSKNIAIEFSYMTGGSTCKTLVQLKDVGDPVIKTIGDSLNWTKGDGLHYTKTNVTNVGTYVNFPKVVYSWGTVHDRTFVNDFYEQPDVLSINPSKAIMFKIESGYYEMVNVASHSEDIELPAKNTILLYELNNEFGERTFMQFDYISEPKPSYKITDSDGKLITEADVPYNEDPHYRRSIFYSHTGDTVYDQFTLDNIKSYTHEEEGHVEDYVLNNYSIYSNDGEKMNLSPAEPQTMVDTINDFLKDKTFGCVTFIYYHNGDKLEVNYLYKITFDGLGNYEALNHDAYFTNTPYRFSKMKLVGSDMTELSKVNISIKKYIGGRPAYGPHDQDSYHVEDQGGQYQIIFVTPGTYKININYKIRTDIMGSPYQNYKEISFFQMVNVDSDMTDIVVTYNTDEKHPFKNGKLTMDVTYSLADGFNMLTKTSDIFDIPDAERNEDPLYCWSLSDSPRGTIYKPGDYISGRTFINTYNSKNLTLNAIWEVRTSIKVNVNGKQKSAHIGIDRAQNQYALTLPTVSIIDVPQGMKHVGWTGGVFGAGVTNDNKVYLPYYDDYYDMSAHKDLFEGIEAVFKHEYKVTFRIGEGSDSKKPYKWVIEGNRVPDIADKLDIKCKPGYTFLGYYVEGDETETIVDLYSYYIHEDTTFVAKFNKN